MACKRGQLGDEYSSTARITKAPRVLNARGGRTEPVQTDVPFVHGCSVYNRRFECTGATQRRLGEVGGMEATSRAAESLSARPTSEAS